MNRSLRATGHRIRVPTGVRLGFAAAGWLAGAWPAHAGRPDYSHLSDAQLQNLVLVNSIGLAAMALLGLYGWWRYRRQYIPAPGRFTPQQALIAVVVVIAVVTALALRQLGLT